MFIFWDDCNRFVPLWNTISQQGLGKSWGHLIWRTWVTPEKAHTYVQVWEVAVKRNRQGGLGTALDQRPQYWVTQGRCASPARRFVSAFCLHNPSFSHQNLENKNCLLLILPELSARKYGNSKPYPAIHTQLISLLATLETEGREPRFPRLK